jgi:hypothetical protein
MPIKDGMIGFSGGDQLIQRAIKFFTRSNWSHSFSVMTVAGHLSTIDTTSTIVEVAPFENKLKEKDYFEIWTPTKASEEEINQAISKTYKEYSAKWYGYLSYLWFMYRYSLRLLEIEPIKMWSWANHGVTCTELTCFFIESLGGQYKDLFEGKDLNTQSPQELYDIVTNNTHLFKYVLSKPHSDGSI